MSLRSIKPWNRQSTLAKVRYVLQQLEEEIKSSLGDHTWVLESSTKSQLCAASWHLTGQTWTCSARNSHSSSISMCFVCPWINGLWYEEAGAQLWTPLNPIISGHFRELWWCDSELGGREFMIDLSAAAAASTFIQCCGVADFTLQKRTGYLN